MKFNPVTFLEGVLTFESTTVAIRQKSSTINSSAAKSPQILSPWRELFFDNFIASVENVFSPAMMQSTVLMSSTRFVVSRFSHCRRVACLMIRADAPTTEQTSDGRENQLLQENAIYEYVCPLVVHQSVTNFENTENLVTVRVHVRIRSVHSRSDN